MITQKKQYQPTEIPPPGVKPEISIPVDPEEPIRPVENPEIIPDEDPFENTPVDYKYLKVSSNVFNYGEIIPEKYTCDGKNVSPPLDI